MVYSWKLFIQNSFNKKKKKESWHQEIYLLNMRTNSQNVTTNWIKRSYANKE